MNSNLETFYKYQDIKEQNQEYLDLIGEPIFKASDLPISYRTINHWHEKGLFPEQHEQGKWRKFSITDYIWVLLLLKLRDHGHSLKSLLKIKKKCFNNSVDLYYYLMIKEVEAGSPSQETLETLVSIERNPEVKKYLQEFLGTASQSYFGLFLRPALELNLDTIMMITPTPEVSFYVAKDQDSLTELARKAADEGAILVSFKSLLNQFLRSDHFKWEELAQKQLTKEEKKILGTLREKGLKEVIVSFKQDKPLIAKKNYRSKKLAIEDLERTILSKKHSTFIIERQESVDLTVKIEQRRKL